MARICLMHQRQVHARNFHRRSVGQQQAEVVGEFPAVSRCAPSAENDWRDGVPSFMRRSARVLSLRRRRPRRRRRSSRTRLSGARATEATRVRPHRRVPSTCAVTTFARRWRTTDDTCRPRGERETRILWGTRRLPRLLRRCHILANGKFHGRGPGIERGKIRKSRRAKHLKRAHHLGASLICMGSRAGCGNRTGAEGQSAYEHGEPGHLSHPSSPP